MSNLEKFTPKKIYEELNDKWKYDELKNKIEHTPEERKRFEILKKLSEKIDNTGNDTEAKLAQLKEEFTAEEETMIRKAIN
jgi:predicted patatin/cPLA2 family phospholipase